MDISKELNKAVSTRFEMELSSSFTLEDLKKALSMRIGELLDKNVERLLSMLYRVDLSQKKLDEIFQHDSKKDIAERIAEAVIERQLKKIETREFYRSKESGLME